MSARALQDCRLTVTDGPWSFALDNHDVIATNWSSARAANPELYNGPVFVLENWSVDGGVFAGSAIRARFADYLYWRSQPAHGFSEAFASSAVRSRDGAVLLARARAGTLNGGRFVSPGGLIDERDVSSGHLDPERAAARELLEETGLDAAEMPRRPGFLLASDERYHAIASVFDSDLAGDALVARVSEFLANEPRPELEAPCLVRTIGDLEALDVPRYTRLLTEAILASDQAALRS